MSSLTRFPSRFTSGNAAGWCTILGSGHPLYEEQPREILNFMGQGNSGLCVTQAFLELQGALPCAFKTPLPHLI